MRVLRLCSVYEAPPDFTAGTRGFDVVGGMQVHTARLTAALDARGVEQTVITAHRPGAPRAEDIGERSRLVQAGVPIRHLRQLYGIAAVPLVARATQVDIVHVHLGEDLAIVPLARWASSRTRAPLVVTVHCSLQHTLIRHDPRSAILRSIGSPAHSWLIRSADAVLVLTDRLAERLVATGISSSQVRVVPLGIDLDAFRRPLPRPALMDGSRWVVYTGRLVRQKGVRELIASLATLAATDTGLVVVGDGPDRSALETLARRSGVEHRVRFVGAVPHADVPAYLQHANVVVLPSWYEERGRILLEAMAAGTPVVATGVGGIPSTVRHGENGLLVEPREPAHLAAAIDRLLGNDALAASMVEAGRATASEHGVGALADATLAAYDAVLGPVTRARRAPLRLVSSG